LMRVLVIAGSLETMDVRLEVVLYHGKWSLYVAEGIHNVMVQFL